MADVGVGMFIACRPQPRRSRASSPFAASRRYAELPPLAASIDRYGLIQPIVLDADNNLIAGGRRLMAYQQLGWPEIQVRRYGELSETERQEIELEENLRRKDLTEYERSKEMVRKGREIAPVISSTLPQKDARGRKREMAAPKRDVAQALGTSEREFIRAELHVETADAYPFMQAWPQYTTLEARTHLERLPEPERPSAVAIIDQPGIPPKDACQALGNLASAGPRRSITTLTPASRRGYRSPTRVSHP